MTRDAEVGAAFAGLTETLVSEYDLAELLHRLADTAMTLCEAAGAGIVVADRDGTLRDVAYTSESVRRLERLQLASGEGPCVECHRSGAVVEVADLESATGRWPRFTPEALRLGLRSARALPLRLRGRTIGALNIFGAEPGPWPSELLRAAQGLADLAMLGIVQHGRRPELMETVAGHIGTALVERSLIEQAKGFLAEHGGLGMDAAFERLRGYADARGTGLTRTAQELLDRVLPADEVLRWAPSGQP